MSTNTVHSLGSYTQGAVVTGTSAFCSEVFVRKAENYIYAKEYQKALDVYNQLVDSGYKTALNKRGKVHLLMGNSDLAYKDFFTAIAKLGCDSIVDNSKYELIGKCIDIYFDRAQIKRSDTIRDYQGAVNDYSRIIQLKNDNADAYFERAKVRLLMRDKESAIRDYNRSAALYNEQGNEESYRRVTSEINQI